MNRRKFLAGCGAVAATALAGCYEGTPSGKFRLTGVGLVERNASVASFVEVENITESNQDFRGFLAPYSDDGVRSRRAETVPFAPVEKSGCTSPTKQATTTGSTATKWGRSWMRTRHASAS